MSATTRLSWLALILISAALYARAQDAAQPQPPPKYRMELVYIFEAGPTEYIFVVGNVGFKSVASLKDFVGRLPPGSTLEWSPGCRRRGDEPLLSSDQEMEEFKLFCAEKNVNFVLVPSG